MNIFAKLRRLVTADNPSGTVLLKEAHPATPLDTDDMEVPQAGDAEPVLDGIRLKIDYVDANGLSTTRLITCKRIVQSDEGNRLLAFCHLRHVDRTFFLSRISGVADYPGGRAIGSIQVFLEPFIRQGEDAETSGSRATRAVLVAAGDELRILAFMARADHLLQEEEDSLISHFLRHRAEELGHEISANYDHQRVMQWFRHQAPDIQVLERAVNRLAQRSNINLQRVWKVATRVMEADGEVTIEELERMHELSAAVDAAVVALRNNRKKSELDVQKSS
jgi:hypothetical protein